MPIGPLLQHQSSPRRSLAAPCHATPCLFDWKLLNHSGYSNVTSGHSIDGWWCTPINLEANCELMKASNTLDGIPWGSELLLLLQQQQQQQQQQQPEAALPTIGNHLSVFYNNNPPVFCFLQISWLLVSLADACATISTATTTHTTTVDGVLLVMNSDISLNWR